MIYIFIAFSFLIICLVEVPYLVQNNYRRDLIVFSFFLILAISLSFIYISGITIPSPNNAIEFVIKSVFSIS
ncbi:hypothetical protein SYNTR_0804 [Candidatus Syntrophocurvum alkaliphilum]|uniref:Uncharacterized protein n=1 Tax=Candidatus Syntrophocurvum alkaliphilum TaxID=2293317 RepID=A0A6I6DDY7_9FIRM|nr:hypothetical protein SYNTR_0804 [Candidatus Syntrophocurvum alkaliphilum]